MMGKFIASLLLAFLLEIVLLALGIDVFASLVGFLSIDTRIILAAANFLTLGMLDFIANFMICWFATLVLVIIVG